jgi:cyclophilin family peptidyl-prolyl cis-trans isomerase
MSTPAGSPRNVPLLVAATVVVVAAIVAIAVGVNSASTAVPVAQNTPPTSVTPSLTPSASPTPSFIPFADCSTASFGTPLQPLNPPADVHKYPAPPPMTIDVSKLYQVTITTGKGKIVLCLQPQLAPVTVNNFVTLTRNHYYDGIPFHRVVALFVDQAGDPNCIGMVPAPPATLPATSSCAKGGPGYQFNDEPVHQAYVNGCLAMANSGVNTNGSQFFICIADDRTQLRPLYNLFGKVQTGMDVATQIAQADLMQSVTVAQSI